MTPTIETGIIWITGARTLFKSLTQLTPEHRVKVYTIH